jgi:hypothetical protein
MEPRAPDVARARITVGWMDQDVDLLEHREEPLPPEPPHPLGLLVGVPRHEHPAGHPVEVLLRHVLRLRDQVDVLERGDLGAADDVVEVAGT